jgi:zinc protease
VPRAAAAAARPPGPERLASVEGITEYRLANGLRLLLFPDPSKQTVTVNVTYLVGSRHEGYGETGMAHLLEHLLFKGTPRHPNVPQELTAHGARPNGSTWYDRTNYFETFAASQENLEWALDLEADRMVNSFVARKDLDSEMTVVRNEFEMHENSPGDVLEERVLATAFLWHNYGKSTIGARADIERVPIERLQAFYRKYYQPDNAVLLVAGRIDEARTLALVQRKFGAIPRPARALPATYTEEPTQDGERSVTLRRSGDVPMVAAAYHVPATAHPDSAAVEVLAGLLLDAPAGRLHKALVEGRKAASVSGYSLALHDPGFFFVAAEVRQEQSLDEARATLLGTLDAAAISPVAKEEVERARAKLLKEIDLTLNAADRVGLYLSEFIGAGDWRLFFLRRDRIRAVTAEQVQAAAARYLKPSNRTVGLFIPDAKPERSEIPAGPDLAGLLKDYKGDAAVASGEAFDPAPAAIEARLRRGAVAGGLKLVLLPKKTRGGAVSLVMGLRFGDEKSLASQAAIADLTTDLLLRGTPRRSRQQIQDELDRLKARVHLQTPLPGLLTVGIETIRDSLPATLALVTEAMREASFPASELEELRQANLAAVEQQKSEPQALGMITFNRHLNPWPRGDPRFVPLPEEQVADYRAVTLEQVKAFHAGFLGAQVGEVAVAGDFDEQAVRAALEQGLAGWRATRPFARVERPFRAVKAERIKLELPDKANALLAAGFPLELRDDDPDWPALVMGNYMLGGGFLNSRLAVRIRQKEGLSYGAGSALSASPLDRSGRFMAYAIFAPQNEARLLEALQDELARALRDGFTEGELKDAKAGWLQSRQVNRSQDAALAQTLATWAFVGRTLAWDEALERKVAALAPGEILAAMRRHLDLSRLTIVTAGDFAHAGAASPAPGAR